MNVFHQLLMGKTFCILCVLNVLIYIPFEYYIVRNRIQLYSSKVLAFYVVFAILLDLTHLNRL